MDDDGCPQASAAQRDAFLTSANVSRETVERLDGYVALLLRWTARINLISRASIADLWRRHIADSAQLLDHAPSNARNWLDLGSGGGLPGLVAAIIAAERRPSLEIGLVESDGRKAAFLAHAAHSLGLSVAVHHARAEHLAPAGADIVSARALASMIDLAPLLARHLHRDGCALLLKGAGVADELTLAQARWHMEVDIVPSRSDPSGVVVIARGIRRAARD